MQPRRMKAGATSFTDKVQLDYHGPVKNGCEMSCGASSRPGIKKINALLRQILELSLKKTVYIYKKNE